MKSKVIWLGLSFLVVAAMVLASCTTSKPTTTLTTTSTTIPTTTMTTATTTPTTTTGNWWDKLGKPQYGGKVVLRQNNDVAKFDPYQGAQGLSLSMAWMEQMFTDD